MNIIYIHGLDSDANSTKGMLLESYCQQYHPDIKVLRPDLNQSPEQVINKLIYLVGVLGGSSKTVLVGSSLGGYFSTLLSNSIGCPALLLNPSTQPHSSLRRFSANKIIDNAKSESSDSANILYTTTGGWRITDKDLQWFANHKLMTLTYPKKIAVWIKEGDELLNPQLSAEFYSQHGAMVVLQSKGDHKFSDFASRLPKVIEVLKQLQQTD